MFAQPVEGWMCRRCGGRQCAALGAGVVCAVCPWEPAVWVGVHDASAVDPFAGGPDSVRPSRDDRYLRFLRGNHFSLDNPSPDRKIGGEPFSNEGKDQMKHVITLVVDGVSPWCGTTVTGGMQEVAQAAARAAFDGATKLSGGGVSVSFAVAVQCGTIAKNPSWQGSSWQESGSMPSGSGSMPSGSSSESAPPRPIPLSDAERLLGLSKPIVDDVVASCPTYGVSWPSPYEPMVFDQCDPCPMESEPSLREAQEAIDTEAPSHAQPDYSDPAFDEPVPLTEDEALEAMADDTCRNLSDPQG